MPRRTGDPWSPPVRSSGMGTTSFARAWTALTAAPDYPAERCGPAAWLSVVGLRLPVRATVAIAVVMLRRPVRLLANVHAGRSPGGGSIAGGDAGDGLGAGRPVRATSRWPWWSSGSATGPSRYGLTFGEWRWGLGLMVAGCVAMTPIVLWYATLPDVRLYYGPSAGPLGEVAAHERAGPDRVGVPVPRLPDADARARDRAGRRARGDDAVRVRPPRQAGAGTVLHPGGRAGLRLAGVADPVHRVGVDRPHLHPDPRHRWRPPPRHDQCGVASPPQRATSASRSSGWTTPCCS